MFGILLEFAFFALNQGYRTQALADYSSYIGLLQCQDLIY